ncbi:hypothetical protein LEMLEM_LOCUS7801 [Lemmus lemmus]
MVMEECILFHLFNKETALAPPLDGRDRTECREGGSESGQTQPPLPLPRCRRHAMRWK